MAIRPSQGQFRLQALKGFSYSTISRRDVGCQIALMFLAATDQEGCDACRVSKGRGAYLSYFAQRLGAALAVDRATIDAAFYSER